MGRYAHSQYRHGEGKKSETEKLEKHQRERQEAYHHINSLHQQLPQPFPTNPDPLRRRELRPAFSAPQIQKRKMPFLAGCNGHGVYVGFWKAVDDVLWEEREESIECPVNGETPSSAAVRWVGVAFVNGEENAVTLEGLCQDETSDAGADDDDVRFVVGRHRFCDRRAHAPRGMSGTLITENFLLVSSVGIFFRAAKT